MAAAPPDSMFELRRILSNVTWVCDRSTPGCVSDEGLSWSSVSGAWRFWGAVGIMGVNAVTIVAVVIFVCLKPRLRVVKQALPSGVSSASAPRTATAEGELSSSRAPSMFSPRTPSLFSPRATSRPEAAQGSEGDLGSPRVPAIFSPRALSLFSPRRASRAEAAQGSLVIAV